MPTEHTPVPGRTLIISGMLQLMGYDLTKPKTMEFVEIMEHQLGILDVLTAKDPDDE